MGIASMATQSAQAVGGNRQRKIDPDNDVEVNEERPVYDPQWQQTLDWVRSSHLGDGCAYCTLCDTYIMLHTGFCDLKRHQQTKKHAKSEMRALNTSERKQVKDSISCHELMLLFLQTHCVTGLPPAVSTVSQRTARYILGLRYPVDITSACKLNPYCVYMYAQVLLDAEGGEKSCRVVLVGYFDEKQAKYCIRILDVFQSSSDDSDSSVSGSLLNILQRFELPASNLVAFYIDDQKETSESVALQIQKLNPKVVHLDGLYSLPDAACNAGLMKHFSQVQGLITNIYRHHSTCSTSNDNLKMLFAGIDGLHDPRPPTGNCEVFQKLLPRMLGMWTDMLSYFTSCDENSEVKHIWAQLENPKLRASVMFLDHALGPLCAFRQHLQQCEGFLRADLEQILREASRLLRSYASSFLRPQAVIRYLKERDAATLENPAFCLPASELSVGGAVEDFISAHEEELEDTLSDFHDECLAFYKTMTVSIADCLPLSDGSLRSMSQLLSPDGILKLTGKSVVDLAVQFGLCAKSEDLAKLADEFLKYQLAEEDDELKMRNKFDEGLLDASSTSSLEHYWSNVLKSLPSASILRKLVLSILALPGPSLEAKKIFAQVVENSDSCHWDAESDTENTPDLDSSDDCSLEATEVSGSKRTGRTAEMTLHSEMVKQCVVRLERISCQREIDLRKNGAGDVIFQKGSVRGTYGWESSLRQKPQARTVFQAGMGTWSKPVSLDQHEKPEVLKVMNETASSASSSNPAKTDHLYQDGKGFAVAELVWGKVKGFSWWPGLVVAWNSRTPSLSMRRVEWFGDGMFSGKVHTAELLPFASFAKCFCSKSYVGLPDYKNAIYQILELAAERCGKSFHCSEKKDEIKVMLEWAFGGFKPTGPDGFLPSVDSSSCTKAESSDSTVSDCQPPVKRKYIYMNKQSGSAREHTREQMVHEVTVQGKNIDSFCLACGTSKTDSFHPLFKGSLCLKCQENLTETLYRYDADGYQSYCTVCCAGLEVILCGNTSCCRCFCKDCLNVLVGPGTFEKLKLVDPWSCYMCLPSKRSGVLNPRADWRVRVQEYFTSNSSSEFELHRVYPSVPAPQRRPIRVISLFDGFATGYLVLKDLGFKVERYIASEISKDSIAVGMVKHKGQIEYVKDVRTITRKHLAEWGPFDLLIGGSPCSDPSMVNPARKEGIGQLFFEYYRMLTMMRPREEDSRPFFWLFENVVAMSAHDKADFCRFLECNPVMIDAVNVNPAHRARYFWGNLPGMSRPLACVSDNTELQDCQDIGCTATGKTERLFSVMDRKENSLWCKEMERIIGSLKHFAEVGNMGQRQKVVGRPWSVPVFRHLFAPLKSYFSCE